MILEQLKYPIGTYKKPAVLTPEIISTYIAVIEDFPSKLKIEVETLSDEQLDVPYRPGGWTIRQLVNHCADSHMNALVRFKLALTEDNPTIKPYREDLWAELADSKSMPIGPALEILDGLHKRWSILLKSLTSEDYNKKYIHPDKGRAVPLDETIGLYAWHCNHHLAHITTLKKSNNW
jgi:uncharacterized damage-inducible protein DinB